MKIFTPSQHVINHAASSTTSSDEEIVIDCADLPFPNRLISPGVGPSAVTVNDIFTLSPVHSARLLSPFARDKAADYKSTFPRKV
jgi:hypothetical protein